MVARRRSVDEGVSTATLAMIAAASAGAAISPQATQPAVRPRGCRSGSVALPLYTTAVHFIADLLTYSAPLCLKRRCDRTPGVDDHAGGDRGGLRRCTWFELLKLNTTIPGGDSARQGVALSPEATQPARRAT
jgi:hypothetical protein